MNRRRDRKRVLVHVDLRRRDLMSSVWLKHWLERLGAEVRLCSRVTLRREFERFRPHATILAHTNEFGQNHNLLVDCAKRSRLFLLPTEDAHSDANLYLAAWEPAGIIDREHPERNWLSYFTHLYSWGRVNIPRIRDAGFMHEDQVVVTGNPRFDLDWGRLFSEPMAGKPIGIVGSFVEINPWDFKSRPWPILPGETKHRKKGLLRRNLDGPEYSFYTISDMRSEVGRSYYPTNRNAEDILWINHAHFRLVLDFLDRWTERGGQVILRPHTMERFQSYELLVERYRPHLTINNDLGFFQFLQKVSGVLVLSTTAIIEVRLANRPIICFEDLLGGRYQEHVGSTTWRRLSYLDYLWRPRTMDELIELAQAATRNELAACPKPEPFDDFLREYYDWPRREPGTLTIAKDVMDFLEHDDLEPPVVSSQRQLRNEFNYDVYMMARRTRQLIFPEHRYLDTLTHHLDISRRQEAELLGYLRQN